MGISQLFHNGLVLCRANPTGKCFSPLHDQVRCFPLCALAVPLVLCPGRAGVLPCSQPNLGEALAAEGSAWLAGSGGTAASAGFKRGEGERAVVATPAAPADRCCCPRTVGSGGLRPGGPGVASLLLLEQQLRTESFEDLRCLNVDPATRQLWGLLEVSPAMLSFSIRRVFLSWTGLQSSFTRIRQLREHAVRGECRGA